MSKRHAILLSVLSVIALAGCSGSSAPPDDGDPTTPPPAETWSKSLGGTGDDWANAVLATNDGYLLAGEWNHQQVADGEGTSTVDGDFWVSKLDTGGNIVWQQALGERRSANGDAVVAYRRVKAAASGYWLVGTQTRAGPSGVITNRDAFVDLQVARLDDNGSVTWARSYDSGPFGNDAYFEANTSTADIGWDVTPLADGGALVVAWTRATLRADATNGVPAAAPWVLRLNAAGDVVWDQRLAETRFEYVADDPLDLLVRETSGLGALVAASTRLRGADPEPALQITRLESGGAVRWSQRYSRVVVRDLRQSRDGSIAFAGEDYPWRLVTGEHAYAHGTILMKLDDSDGTEDWRQVMDDGVTVKALSEQCRQREDATWLCYYIVAGSGKRNDEGASMAMLVRVGNDGSRDSDEFFDDLEFASDAVVQAGVPLDPYTPLVVVGRARNVGGSGPRGFLMVINPTLSVVASQAFRPWSATPSGLHFDSIMLRADGRVVASAPGTAGFALRTFAADGTAGLTRDYGGISERRGERAFDAIQVGTDFIVAGQVDGPVADRPATLVAKFRNDGAVEWQRSLAGLSLVSPRGEAYEAIAEAGDGGAVLAGAQGQGLGDADLIRAVRLDGNGNVTWTSVPLNPDVVVRGWGPDDIGVAYASSVQRASDGGFFVAGGMHFLDEFDYEAWITSISSSGDVRWQRRLKAGLRISSVRPLADGGAVLAGISERFGTRTPWAARIAANGSLTWTREYSVEGANSDPVARIALAPDGGFLLAASHRLVSSFDTTVAQAGAGGRNALLIRLNSDGSARWHRTYGGLLDETIFGLDSTSDGGFVVAGRSDSLGERGEAWVLRLGPDGLVNAGCNALRTAREGTNHTAVDATLLAYSGTGVDAEAVRGNETSSPSSSPTRTLSETVMARQCSGVSQPDGGGAAPSRFRLTVSQGNAGTPGIVTSTPAGITCGTGSNICEATYLPNTTVTLRIDPGMSGRFLSWSGCDLVTADRCLVNMTSDKTITASFRAPNSPQLNVAVTGNGQVTGGGMSCRAASGVCAQTYSPGELVTLMATPDASESFLGWGGSCEFFASGSPIEVEMAATRSCIARFTGAPQGSPVVSVSLEPAMVGPLVGYVRSTPAGISCGSSGTDCSSTFVRDSTVRLDAVSTDGNWDVETLRCTGGLTPRGSRAATFTATLDVSCVGVFASDIERLSLRMVSDSGGAPLMGRIVSQNSAAPRHLDCREDCDRPFTSGTTVTLRAEPENGYVLSNWSGCDATPADPAGTPARLCQVNMNRARVVFAAYTRQFIGESETNVVAAIGFPFDSADGRVEWIAPPGIPPCTPAGGGCQTTVSMANFNGVPTEVSFGIWPAGNNTLTLHEGCDVFTPPAGASPAICRITMNRDRGVVFSFGQVNSVPTAVISRTPTGSVAVNQAIQFSAAASTDDQDVSQLTYRWDFNGDNVIDSTGITATHSYPDGGLYEVRLQVVDALGAVGVAWESVDVITANTPPAARFTFSPGTPIVGNAVTFDASTSTDNSGISSYRWDFNGDGIDDASGDENVARIVQHTYNATGTYDVRLRAIDFLGAVGETTRQVTVGQLTGGLALTLQLRGGGSGVVTYVPIVTACSKDSEPTCVRQFPAGTTVVLRGSAYTGSALGDWIGCDSLNATGNECTVTLNAARTVQLFIN
jgi:hypothetical protein